MSKQTIAKGVIINILAMGKPRMTRSDRWKKRDCVLRYRSWCDELRAAIGEIPQDAYRVDWTAYFPIPKSYSKKQREAMKGQLHQVKPDRDNIDKAVCDALFKQDQVIAQGSQCKMWSTDDRASMVITIYYGSMGKVLSLADAANVGSTAVTDELGEGKKHVAGQ